MNVDGIPNVRTCVTSARDGMVVRHQNAWPSLERDVLSIAQRLDWLMPVGWYYKLFTTPQTWHAAEPFIRKAAGLGDVPATDSGEREYEHAFWQTETAVIGGGPAGLQATIDAVGRGGQVTLIDDQPALGGSSRYRRGAASPEALITKLRSSSSVRIIHPAFCFGLYESGLLGVVQQNPHAGAAERLVHLRAQRVVVATGAYEAPLTFRNNDLPGVMLMSGVQRLIRLYGIAPGKRAVVVACDEQGEEIAADL